MNKYLHKFLPFVLVVGILVSMVCHVGAANVTSFSDVPQTHWGYKTVMAMAGRGLFKGTTEPVNGVGTFSPEIRMTRAEFITVALRAVCPEKAQAIGNVGEKWWTGLYNLALKEQLLYPTELDNGDMDKPMSRQEMAMVMVRCVEKQGERPEMLVDPAQIADYATISDYYRENVRECFSFGLLGGVDIKGTFKPLDSLTRAEGATVLCRLVDKSTRLQVVFQQNTGLVSGGDTGSGGRLSVDTGSGGRHNGNTGIDAGSIGGSGNTSGSVSGGGSGNTSSSVSGGNSGSGTGAIPGNGKENELVYLPWENGGKQPSEYTYAEFTALTVPQQNAFSGTFKNKAAFEAWLKKAEAEANKVEVPWENGGKQPKDYTLEEFEALIQEQKKAFVNSFRNEDAYAAWLEKAQGGSKEPEQPLDKVPEDYTWEEYMQMTEAEKEVFIGSFRNEAAYEAWLERVKEEQVDTVLPLNKRPSDYTWEEFLGLTPEEKEIFQEEINRYGGFEAWLEKEQSGSTDSELPLDKAPEDYTWEEFEALTPTQQDTFRESFYNSAAFEAWVRRARENTQDNTLPLDKNPSDYTWEEFLDLTEEEKEIFQEEINRYGGFEAWLNKVLQMQE